MPRVDAGATSGGPFFFMLVQKGDKWKEDGKKVGENPKGGGVILCKAGWDKDYE